VVGCLVVGDVEGLGLDSVGSLDDQRCPGQRERGRERKRGKGERGVTVCEALTTKVSSHLVREFWYSSRACTTQDPFSLSQIVFLKKNINFC